MLRVAYFFVLIAFIVFLPVLGFVIGGWFGVVVAGFFGAMAYMINRGEF